MSERRLRECGGEARSTARCYAIYVGMHPYIGPYSSTGLSTTRSLLSSQANAAVEQQKTLRFRATHCERSAWWPFLAVDSTACRPVRRIRKPSIPHGQRDVRCWPQGDTGTPGGRSTSAPACKADSCRHSRGHHTARETPRPLSPPPLDSTNSIPSRQSAWLRGRTPLGRP